MTPCAPSLAITDTVRKLTVAERMRIGQENRLRKDVAQRLGIAKHSEITEAQIEEWLIWMGIPSSQWTNVKDLKRREKDFDKLLQKLVAKSVFGPFVSKRVGVGEVSFARVWAAIGDPLRRPDGTERSFASLKQYAGYGAPEFNRHPRQLKSRLYVLAEYGGIRIYARGGPAHYRDIYDQRKAERQGKRHESPCSPCGTLTPEQAVRQKELDTLGIKVKLKREVKAEVGTLWRDGHINHDAIRTVIQTFLGDLYEEARSISC